MGRSSYSNKTEADGLKKMEIWWLKKYGYLNGWKSGSVQWTSGWDGSKSSIGIEVVTCNDDFIRFHYTQTDYDGKKEDFNYKVRLTTTPCRYGRFRYWFICPLIKNGSYCGRRVGVLYKAGNYFGCRHCYDLNYSSQKENRRYKLYYLFRVLDIETKAEKLRENMKRQLYAGKPTKKFKRLLRLLHRAAPYTATLLENDKRGIL